MNHPKDLVYVITGLNRAGAELVCLSQVTYFASLGYRVGVIYLVEGHDQLVPDFEAAGAETVCLGMRSFYSLPQALLRCCRMLRKWRPRIVHSHMIHATILVSLIKWTLPRVKLVVTAHSLHEGGRMLYLLQRLTRRAPDLATNVSEAATAAYVSHGLFNSRTAKCIPNGVDVNKFRLREDPHARTEGTFTYVCVAQFRPEKNHRSLLAAFARTYAARPNSRLLLLGEGPMLRECKALAHALGCAQAVTFAGGNADVVAALHSADAFVLVSHYEGFGLAAAEAMAVGLPIVGADVPGLREVIGSKGALVAPDDIDAISTAMLRCADTPDDAEQRCGRRNHIVQNFSRDTILSRWALEYRRLGLERAD
ncbi:glycosyltransferase [uncultured Ralstonia sp.]|jgi:glycosyltransferase involved in cell wall biosynthesis|uniref:glycosyltransferase n=1 Tax=Ralstonia sp. TaxID=54061 RepID=UPI001EA464D4|nr:glycosyltransferase [uncultured Ralstonia sp.]UCF24647.1 MAG: glycosyltransferase [Ralstonia sp.]